jgi:phosphinothricin acetyltransferase
MKLRLAMLDDLQALTALYNHYVETAPTTFDVEPFSVEARREWYNGFAAGTRHQLWVAEDAEQLLGFACSRPFRPKAAYLTSVESTVYCARGATGRGVGRALYGALFDALQGQDVHRAYAGITQPNPASEALHVAFGFREVATFSEVGRKLGRYWDVRWFEKSL